MEHTAAPKGTYRLVEKSRKGDTWLSGDFWSLVVAQQVANIHVEKLPGIQCLIFDEHGTCLFNKN